MYSRYILPMFFFLLLISACRKDQDGVKEIFEDIPSPTVSYEVDIRGFVVNEDGMAVEGVEVFSDFASTMTNELGYFTFSSKMSSNEAVITARKGGYFDSFSALHLKSGVTLQTRIQMVERTLAGQFSTSIGGTVQANDGATVDFKAQSIRHEDGSSYDGNVHVYARYYHPRNQETLQSVGSNMLGIDESGAEQILESFGMLNVELESDAGDKLQLSQSATISLPLDGDLEFNAPNEIPLWHYDAENQVWREEGKAIKAGGKYTGEVNHFSLWNCDDSFELVQLNGNINMDQFHPWLKVCVTRVETGSMACTNTDSDGNFGGQVPANELLLVEVVEALCGEVLFSSEFGPLTTDLSLNLDLDTGSGIDWVTVHGNVSNCDMNPVTDGVVMITALDGGGRATPIFINSDGSYEGLIYNCSSTSFSMKATDFTNLTYGSDVNFGLPYPVAGVDLSACGNAIVNEVSLDLENGNVYTIPGCIVERTADSAGYIQYHFTAVDDQGSAKIMYEFDVIDWNGNPSDPLYAFAYSLTTFLGSPDPIWNIMAGNIILNFDTDTPGGFISFTLTDSAITNSVSGQTYTGRTVEIVGLVQ